MQYQYTVLEEESVYSGFFHVSRYAVDIEYYDGSRSGALIRECLGKKGRVVAALPYDLARKEFVLVEQFRIGAMAAGDQPWQKEVVAGFMDKAGESPETAMQRELAEEIGTTAQDLEFVYEYYGSPGGSAGRTLLYFARIDVDETAAYTGLRAEGEDIRVVRLSFAEAYVLLQSGQADNSTLLIALQAFVLKYSQYFM